MNSDFMMIVSALEKDKGIDRDILLESIRSALIIVARKVLNMEENEPLSVIIDNVTGEIAIFDSNQHKLDVDNLGRIAAQTAKQVIMQKIKEAENDVIYDTYKNKIGELVNGVIKDIDRGNIILEVGRTEALLPRSEQVFKDNYQLHDRLRVYVTDIQRSRSSLKLIVSRSISAVVQKLFQFEVPEIVEGTVEIKGIVREAGDRTKIAVYSKLSNIDCVGACVGMRGSRVKSIVNELNGEKIDIIRWDEDIEVFIRNALSPAEIVKMNLDYDNKICLVIVPKDKLSLAIGKKGQNARLAAKLTKWDIDIQASQTTDNFEINKLFKDGTDTNNQDQDMEKCKEEAVQQFILLKEIDEQTAKMLVNAGFTTLEHLAQAESEDISNVTQMSAKQAQIIIDLAKNK